MNTLLHLFFSGLVLGGSICGLHCVVLLAPVVARESRDWKDGVRTGLVFGAGKSLALAVMGALAGRSAHAVRHFADSEIFPLAGGTALVLVGVWFFFSRGRCGRLFPSGSPLVLGVVDGLIPCAPTLGFLVYLVHLGGGTLFGAAAGLFFGLGTVAGLVLAVCGLIPTLWGRLSACPAAGKILRFAGSAVFFAWGLLMLLPVFLARMSPP